MYNIFNQKTVKRILATKWKMILKANIERLSVKVMKNVFDGTQWRKWSDVFLLFLVSPCSVETHLGRSYTL